jgi:WXXGXW repeat (2 copies)
MLLVPVPMARISSLAPLSWLLWLACSSSLPMPPVTDHPARAYVEVPYPPPAALVEVVPEPPKDTAGVVWLDGHWVWRGRYYVWQRGGWLKPPENAAYATWQSALAKDGRLIFAPGTWYDPNHRPLPAPDVLVVARTPANQTTAETETAR